MEPPIVKPSPVKCGRKTRIRIADSSWDEIKTIANVRQLAPSAPSVECNRGGRGTPLPDIRKYIDLYSQERGDVVR